MKIRFGKDATGPYVEVTHTVRDQDDLVGADFYALDPEDRMKVCEHLPRAVNDRPAVRDHSEATASPPPGTVAALLAKVEEARREASDNAREAALEGASSREDLACADAYREAARLITATLGAPTPLDRAVAEVCGNGATVTHGASLAAGLSPDDHLELAVMVLRAKGGRLRLPTLREQMAMAARVLLAGMLACDASATKEPG